MTVTQYILHLLENDPYWKFLQPSAINNGNCDSFAQNLEDKFKDGMARWGDEVLNLFEGCHFPDGHCFFERKGLYYDAECPEGVESPVLLPYYERQKYYSENFARPVH